MNHISVNSEISNCSGCGACFAACPKNAISMVCDVYGNKYADVNKEQCVNCGKCLDVCSYSSAVNKTMPLKAYAAISVSREVAKNSASGGVFASLAESCIKCGASAAGAIMECGKDGVQVYHSITDNNISAMQGSKYVQSDAWKIYNDVVLAIKEGRTVLFSGTPCQVNAIKKLTGDPENLITIDLICHGVPSLQMLNDYVDITSRRFMGIVNSICFRDKTVKKNFTARITIERNNKTKDFYLRSHFMSFYKLFLEGAIYRESCYSCQFAGIERVSDITIGDYWGIEQFHADDIKDYDVPEKNDWSCILVNTKKGQDFLDKHMESLLSFESNIQWVKEYNAQLNRPSQKSDNRDKYLQLYRSGGYDAIERQFIKENGGYIKFYRRMIKSIYSLGKRV